MKTSPILLLITITFLFSSLLVFHLHPASAKTLFEQGLNNAAKGTGHLTDTTAKPLTIEERIAQIIQVALSFLGVIFLLLMIYGGFLWMTAKGNDQQVEKAKNLITAAIIGLVIVVAAYAITYFIVQLLSEETLWISK